MTSADDRYVPRPEIDLLLSLARIEPSPDVEEHCRGLLADNRDTFDWGFLVDVACRHKVMPLISSNVVRCRLDGSSGTNYYMPYQWLFESAYYANKCRNEALATEFGQIFLALNDADIQYAVRKGPAVTESLYKDVGLRRMNDLDILANKTDIPRVAAVLAGLGYRQGHLSADGSSIEPFARSTQAFWRMNVNNELPYLKISADPAVSVFEIDLCLDVFQKHSGGAATTSDLLARRLATNICGAPAFSLAPRDEFMDLCLHLHKEATSRYYVEAGMDLQLQKFLDVALCSARVTRDNEWQAVLPSCLASGAAESVYYAMHFTAIIYPDFIPEPVLSSLRPDDTDFLDQYGGLEGNVGRWRNGFLERLFASDRRKDVEGLSSVRSI